MTIRNMATGPKESREPLQCPQRVAERELGIRPTCAGVKAKSMADVRRHLSRPPHLIFIELCPMCNENFLDKDVFDREHGDNGQFCDIIGSQSRGQRQWQQWRQICEQLKKLINVSDHSVADKFFLTDLSSLRIVSSNVTKDHLLN